MKLNEIITWIPVSEKLPDDFVTVFLFSPVTDEPVWLGYREETSWSYVDNFPANPTHWAAMLSGPTADDDPASVQSPQIGIIGRSAAEAILDSIASISACMTSSPRDWSIDHRDAWMWGIVRGWDDDSMAELVAKHKWSSTEVIRLKSLHQAFNPKPENINDFAKIIIASNGQQVLFLKEIDDGENVLTGLVQYPGYQAKIGYRGISDANFEEILMTLTVKDADKLVDECRFESLGSDAS
jgi:hypothetical protein